MNIATKKDSIVFNTALRYRLIPTCAGTVTIAAGGLVLVGWLLGMRPLLSVMPGYVTMKPNTAFCFVLGGLALWLLRFPRSQQAVRLNPKHHRIGQVCALLVVFVGLLTLGEYFCHLNLRIDQTLLPDTLSDARISFPGRMSISAAIGFCMLGSSLFFLGTKHARGAMTSQILAVIGLVEVVMAFLGYAYGVEGLYSTTFYATMAIHTIFLFGILFVGILFARPEDGLMSVITDRHGGGQMARFFLPLAFTVPFLVGWLRLKGQQFGLYGTEFGLTLFATSNIIIFTILVWLSAKSQNTRAVQLAGSENEFRTMLDAIPQLAWIARPDGYIYWYNQQWYDYTNTTLEQMQGDGWATVHDPAVFPSVNERWRHCLLTGEPFEFEFPLKGGDNNFRWFLTRCFPLKGGDGKILRWFGTNTDISRKREAEEEIRLLNTGLEKRVMERTEELVLAKARLQDVLDAATHVAVVATNPKGIITVFNSGAERMLGYTSEEMVGKQVPNFFHLASEVIARGLELTQEMGRPVEGFDVFVEKARNGQSEEREWTYVRKDGSHLSVNLVVTAQQDAAGETTGFLGVAMDVTARKKSEETLRVNEERFRLIVNAVKDYALFMLDQDGCVATWNAGAERIKGYKEAEIVGKHFSCFYLPEDIQAGHPKEELQIAAQQGRYSEEGWRVRKNGTLFLADVVITAIRDKTGKLRGFAKVTRDITDRKKVDKALQRQALLLDMANDTIFIRDGEDRITYWNQGAQRLYGWSKEEVLGQVTHSLLNTRFPQPLDEIKAQVLKEGHWEGELVHTRA